MFVYTSSVDEEFGSLPENVAYFDPLWLLSSFLSRQIDGIAPTFAQKPSIKQEEDGKRLRFECRILADPRPEVSWFHGGNPVKNGGRYRVSSLIDCLFSSSPSSSSLGALRTLCNIRASRQVRHDAAQSPFNHLLCIGGYIMQWGLLYLGKWIFFLRRGPRNNVEGVGKDM